MDGLVVDLLRSYHQTQMKELLISPGHTLQVKLHVGVVRFPEADNNCSKETSDGKALEAVKTPTSWTLA